MHKAVRIGQSDLNKVASGTGIQKGIPTIGLGLGFHRRGICRVPRLGGMEALKAVCFKQRESASTASGYAAREIRCVETLSPSA